ncbi:hypothetical protein GCM10022255_080550 [Dactylosporangium darangshiense]|uniref:Septum formation initiator n=2 Tax=Dactylosporangium darangshiense TaxID=579108 RepID=A0ABP8DL14_9ACTN
MRWTLAVGAWLAAAVLATAASIGAVNSLRQGLFGGPADSPRHESEVEAELSAGPSPAVVDSPSPSAPASASFEESPPASVTRALSTGGGSLVVSCDGGTATLMSWIPRAGFEADHVVRGPADVVSLRFKARSGGGQFRARVTCAGGEPSLTVSGDD